MVRVRPDAAAVILEWSDLDPRLGIRHLGGWRTTEVPDIIRTVTANMSRFQDTLFRTAEQIPLVVALPSLPLPPIPHTPMRQTSGFETSLQESLNSFAANVAGNSSVRLVSHQWLNLLSPLQSRRDVRSELAFGFPYQLPHASVLAESLASLMSPDSPKKGLITDLDDTLWSGILGEVGVHGVSWDLSNNSQLHGLYQQLLMSLSDAGVLIAAASKNDGTLVDEAFQRDDILLGAERIYPIEAHWGPKSGSVSRILQAWNIGADSVVFVDDNPMELEEVKSVHPDVECILFPRQDPQAVYELLYKLRDSFGKAILTEEDALRLDSLRRAQASQEQLSASNGRLDEFLKNIDAEVSMNLAKVPMDTRALELINKTNQFNLNGERFTESSWRAHLQNPDTFLLLVSYRDKYGPIGKIALLSGCIPTPKKLQIQTWVMSCRAFARRIEYQCLGYLFEKFQVEEVVLDYQKTPRNGPTQEFFAELFDYPVAPRCQLSREYFLSKCPPLFHSVKEVSA
jgi:FkbH-like protein